MLINVCASASLKLASLIKVAKKWKESMISDASEGGEGETPRRLDQGIFVLFFFLLLLLF